MKVIIPVAGIGFKLRPHTNTQPKALIPLAGKTILSIIIEQFRDKGVKEFIFIVGHLGEKIEEYVKEHHTNIKGVFIYQNERKGTAHAISLTEHWVKNEDAIIVFGDTICEFDIKKLIKSKTSVLCVHKVDDPRKFGVAVIEEETLLINKVVEKPQIPTSNLALVGIYKIKETKLLFECITQLLKAHTNDEKQLSLTDCLECMIQKHISMHAMKVESWFDCGKAENILNTNAILLKKFKQKTITKSSSIIRSVIIPPVSIPPSCKIENSIIGPNVTIGEYAKITNTVIHNSIIGSYSSLHHCILQNSLIGSDTEVQSLPKSLNIGDDTKVDL